MIDTKYPTIRHPFCRASRCEFCLDDHLAVGSWLRERCHPARPVDFLAQYRAFMDRRLGRSSQTEYGWGDPVIFKSEHLTAFVEQWRNDHAET